MKTAQLYYNDSYQKEASAKIIEVTFLNGKDAIILDQSIFHPRGGGQRSDKGQIKGDNFSFQVDDVCLQSEEIYHLGNFDGEANPNDEVSLSIDWDYRYQNMKLHSGGHLLYFLLEKHVPNFKWQKASHEKKSFQQFHGEWNDEIKEKIEKDLNDILKKGGSVEIQYMKKRYLSV